MYCLSWESIALKTSALEMCGFLTQFPFIFYGFSYRTSYVSKK